MEKAERAILQGDQALRNKDMDRALFEYLKALELDPQNVQARYQIAVVLGTQGRLELSEHTFREALAEEEGHASVLEGLGLVLLRQGKHDAAVEYLEHAIAVEPERWRAHNALGLIHDLHGDHKQAAEHYEAALAVQPKLPMLLNNLGYSNYLQGDLETAQDYFNQALAQHPEHRKTWSNLGLLYARQGEYNKSLDALLRVMNEPQALNNVGYICMLNGQYEQAEKHFKRAISASPTYYETAQANLKRVRTMTTSLESPTQIIIESVQPANAIGSKDSEVDEAIAIHSEDKGETVNRGEVDDKVVGDAAEDQEKTVVDAEGTEDQAVADAEDEDGVDTTGQVEEPVVDTTTSEAEAIAKDAEEKGDNVIDIDVAEEAISEDTTDQAGGNATKPEDEAEIVDMEARLRARGIRINTSP